VRFSNTAVIVAAHHSLDAIIPATMSVAKAELFRNGKRIAHKPMYFSASRVNLCVLFNAFVRARINHRIGDDPSQVKTDQC
jgi:hypothetical protein